MDKGDNSAPYQEKEYGKKSRRHFYTSLGSSVRENPKRFGLVMKNQSKASSVPSTIAAKVTIEHQTFQINRIKAKTPQST